jgi:undecaprenyl pyrophosphate phosphatase UppP
VLGIIGAGAGIPPEMSNATSWSIAGSLVLLLGYVVAFAIAVVVVAWVDRRLSSRRLFQEIYRELGIGGRPPR